MLKFSIDLWGRKLNEEPFKYINIEADLNVVHIKGY